PEAVIAFAAPAIAVDPPAGLAVFAVLVGLDFDAQIEPAPVIVPALLGALDLQLGQPSDEPCHKLCGPHFRPHSRVRLSDTVRHVNRQWEMERTTIIQQLSAVLVSGAKSFGAMCRRIPAPPSGCLRRRPSKSEDATLIA